MAGSRMVGYFALFWDVLLFRGDDPETKSLLEAQSSARSVRGSRMDGAAIRAAAIEKRNKRIKIGGEGNVPKLSCYVRLERNAWAARATSRSSRSSVRGCRSDASRRWRRQRWRRGMRRRSARRRNASQCDARRSGTARWISRWRWLYSHLHAKCRCCA